MKTVIVTFGHTKGGTTKSTTLIHAAREFAARKKKVLVIDFDPQSTVSVHFCPDFEKQEKNVKRVFDDLTSANGLPGNIVAIEDYIDLVPGNLDMLMQSNLVKGALRRNIVNLIKENDSYDYILVDTAGTLDGLVWNGLIAADIIVSPVLADESTLKNTRKMSVFFDLENPDLLNRWYLVLQRFKNSAAYNQYRKIYRNGQFNVFDAEFPELAAIHNAKEDRITLTEENVIAYPKGLTVVKAFVDELEQLAEEVRATKKAKVGV